MAARAWIHCPDEHESGRVGEGDCGPGDRHLPVFKRLSQKIENASPELREFVQKEHPVVSEADLAGPWKVPASHETGIGDGVVGGAELAFYDKGVVVEHPGHAEYLGSLKSLIEAKRRQNPREALGEHRLARPRGPDHEHVMRTRRSDFQAALRVLLAFYVFEIQLARGFRFPYRIEVRFENGQVRAAV